MKPIKYRQRKSEAITTLVVLFSILLCLISAAANFMFWTRDVATSHRVLLSSPHHDYSKVSLEPWNFDSMNHDAVITVVQTRFMQLQPTLVALGRARLAIFRTFCLPTMVGQSTQKYLWIIRADPDLNRELREEMVSMIAPYANILFIGSNFNPEGFRQAAPITREFVWSGSFELWERFHSAAQSRVVVETRLDADDGLHVSFVEHMQQRVATDMASRETSWLVYCADRHLEWHEFNPFHAEHSAKKPHGVVVATRTPYCITAGLTFVYGTSIRREDIPKAKHSMLHNSLLACPAQGTTTGCMFRLNSLIPCAIRARTTGSAGMKDVVVPADGMAISEGPEIDAFQLALWIDIGTTFAISSTSVSRVRRYLVEKRTDIALDNLKGQCTKGHSCKTSSKTVLESLAKNISVSDMDRKRQ